MFIISHHAYVMICFIFQNENKKSQHNTAAELQYNTIILKLSLKATLPILLKEWDYMDHHFMEISIPKLPTCCCQHFVFTVELSGRTSVNTDIISNSMMWD